MFEIAVGNLVPYKGDFYIITAINKESKEVTLNNILGDISQFNVSYVYLDQTINSLLGKRKSRSQSPNSRKRSKRSRGSIGGKKSRKKSTLKRGK